MTSGQRGTVPARGSTRAWSGRGVAQARAFMAMNTKWPCVCGQCGKRVDKSKPWAVGHIKPRATHPELTWDPSNWQIEHRKCSNKSGQGVALDKAREEGRRQAQAEHAAAQGTTPPLPSSLSDESGTVPEGHGFPRQDSPLEPPPLPESPSEQPVQVNDALLWPSHDLRAHAWLRDLADIPEDAAPPLYMTPVPAAAACSYGWAGCAHMPEGLQPAVPWIEETQGITLRWWQRLSLVRQLEHDAAGDLVWRKKDESAPRRAGKSVGLRGGALWRMATGPTLWGEPQNVIHCGSDLNICREIQRGAWTWAEGYGWTVTRGNGKEAIEAALARWLVRAQDGVYGYDCSLGLVDEGWDVRPDTVSEGLEPATLERVNPQLVITSTAHRRATSLMRTELANALTMADPAVLLLLWGAPPTTTPEEAGDPRVWRAASPHWSADRERMIRAKYAAALAGQDDPEFDDPDPMRGFMAQYLNVWTIAEKRLIGRPVVEAEPWAALHSPAPASSPDAVAIEAWFDQGVSVAEAWRATDGRVTVRVTDYPTLDAAARHVATLALRRPAIVGTSLADHPAWRANRVTTKAASAATRTQVGELMRTLREDTLRHTGSPALTDQVLALRTTPGADGPNIASKERADAIKAAMWAASAAAASTRRKAAIPSRYQVA